MKYLGKSAFWPLTCAIVAVIQVAVSGYTVGYGNQSVQIPYLYSLIDPSLYAGDPLIESFTNYPSLFYRGLAYILRHIGGIEAVPVAYVVLHAIAAYLVIFAAASIARSLTGRQWPAVLTMLFLIGAHQHGIAESALYAGGFTHTWLGLGLSLLALALWLSGRFMAAALLAGLAFNVHALLASYAMIFMGAGTLTSFEWHKLPHYLLGGLLLVLAAAPSLCIIYFDHGGTYDPTWVELLRARSSHHVFPSTWWAAGDPQIPRFLVTWAFAAIGFGLCPLRDENRKRLGGVLAAGLLLFACGIAFTQWHRVPIVMRAQLFRSSQLLMVFLLVGVAMAIGGLAAIGRNTGDSRRLLILAGRTAGLVSAALVFLAYAVPGLESWRLPILLAVAALTVMAGRLTWWAAAAVSVALVVHVAGHVHLGLPLLPNTGFKETLLAVASETDWLDPLWVIAAVGLALCLLVLALGRHARLRLLQLLCAISACAVIALLTHHHLITQQAKAQTANTTDPWLQVQLATQRLTPVDARIMVPPRRAGFRIHAKRAISGEWRDGTQQFFDPDYAARWYDNMSALMPGLETAPGRGLVKPGLPYAEHSTDTLLALAERLNTQWIVIPASHPKQLVELYSNASWRLYKAERIPPPPPPDDVADPESWHAQQAFIQEVVLPNIERYRKRDIEVRFVSPNGASDRLGRRYRIAQSESEFGFGSALEPFREPAAPPKAIGNTRVSDRQLERFADIFNYSVIGYSGKWRVMEPTQGEPDYADLDAYVDWCTTNNVRLQYHFVSGYMPEWVSQKSNATDRASLLMHHATALLDRYGDRIKDWQIVNEKHLLQASPAVFTLFREKLPEARLGISDCARFQSSPQHSHRHRRKRPAKVSETDKQNQEMRDLCRGLSSVDWLIEKGVTVDFFAFHAHRPFGLWADPRTVYQAFDAFAERGVRIHVSEFGIHFPGKIEGGIRKGEWTRELQAEYYKYIYTVMFSHPSVDVINLWGMGHKTWIKGAGLVDEEGTPNASFHTLKELIHTTWRTHQEDSLPIDGVVRLRGFHGSYNVYIDDADTPAATFFVSSATNTPVTVDVELPR